MADYAGKIAEFVVNKLLDAYLLSCYNFHSLVGVCQQDALLDHLAAVLVSCNLLKMLQHRREDHFVPSLCPDQTKAFFYDVVATNVADQLKDSSFF